MIKTNALNFLNDIYNNNLSPEMNYFNKYLLNTYIPDINGYTLVFFISPPFKLLPEAMKDIEFNKFMTFAAMDFTPGQLSITGSTINPHTGGYPLAAEVGYSQQCSVTFIDNSDLSIYTFHSGWYEYIKGLSEGMIPSTGSNTFPKSMLPDNSCYIEDGLDYVGAFYVVKYEPSMSLIKFIAKCTGVFPQTLPSKELIGTRNSNELTTLPFTYFCAFYEEALEEGHPIWKELLDHLKLFGEY